RCGRVPRALRAQPRPGACHGRPGPPRHARGPRRGRTTLPGRLPRLTRACRGRSWVIVAELECVAPHPRALSVSTVRGSPAPRVGATWRLDVRKTAVRRRARLGVVGVAAATLLLTSCAESERDESDGNGEAGGTFVFAGSDEPKLLDPAFASDGETFRVAR